MGNLELDLIEIDVDKVLSRISTVAEAEIAIKLLPEIAHAILAKMQTLSK